MKIFKKLTIFGFFLFATLTAFSQAKITGVVVDQEFNEPLPGANVLIKGTKDGSTTGFDGKFSISTSLTSGEIVISYLGYKTKTISFTMKGNSINVGNISLSSDENQLETVVLIGTGIIDLAKDRKTPIAVSTIKAAEIQAKVGTADVTQALVNTPSVYVAGQAGGYGDSRIAVRGFQQDNTAFLLNGQPINGMEDGKMYWSNWSGMSDIANAIQIQRGLGSSKLAISSVGGTVNFVTKATDKKEGGFASLGVANNDYFKTLAGYNTGIMENGFGASIMLSHWQGDGYNIGTRGQGQNYFISFGYKLNDKHNFNFLITGAPQWHDQNFSKTIKTYLEKGKKYNDNWGTLNGNYKTERRNFYHKPVANLNWDFNISDKTQLSTVIYASWGRGGGTGNYGSRVRNAEGQVDFDAIYANNQAANGEGMFGNNTYLIRSSMNNHSWYGLVTNLKHDLTENLSLNVGLDLRTYEGTHYRQVGDFVGLNSWTETRPLRGEDHLLTSTTGTNTVTESLRPDAWVSMFNSLGENQRIDYDYSETISYGGVFGQLEYANDNFSAFFQGSISNQSHKRTDRYDYLPQFKDSEKVNNVGYNVKAGGSYFIAEQHSIYANAGYYSRQPYHDNIYLNYTNAVNPNTSNEKILGLEAGYGFQSSIFSANVNLYATSWKDRIVAGSRTVRGNSDILPNGSVILFRDQGVEQFHTGAELDFVLRPVSKLDIKGFASYGDWQYKGTSLRTETDESLVVLRTTSKDVDGGKVGDAAQTTWGLGAKYEIFERFSVDADWRNYYNLYSNVGAVKENLELPEYDLVDAGISYKMLVGKEKKNSVNLRLNVNNVFGEVYLSELNSNDKAVDGDETFKGIKTSNQGYFGLGRTWNFTLRYNF